MNNSNNDLLHQLKAAMESEDNHSDDILIIKSKDEDQNSLKDNLYFIVDTMIDTKVRQTINGILEGTMETKVKQMVIDLLDRGNFDYKIKNIVDNTNSLDKSAIKSMIKECLKELLLEQ